MHAKERLWTAWSHKEPDRVPIELSISQNARNYPESERIQTFIRDEADNFRPAPGFDWGFFGLETAYKEEIIEDVPENFQRIKRVHATEAGEFYAITRHNYGELAAGDFHWEKRYIDSLEDFQRLAEAPREKRPFDANAYRKACEKHGERGLTTTVIQHPLGNLVHHATMEQIFIWLFTEKEITKRFLENCTQQIIDSLLTLEDTDLCPIFVTYAYEMLIPPWMGMDGFQELVFPFDKPMNDAIHRIGGLHRAHCHGMSGGFLETFADMGIDALEPLEPPPFADNDLADAKKRVGDRMLLSGNVCSQNFVSAAPEDVRTEVKEAIRKGAPGGGFTLRTTGGGASTGSAKSHDDMRTILRNIEAYIDAAKEFGQYPIQV